MKKIAKLIGRIVVVVVFAAIALVGWLSVTEYMPADVESVAVTQGAKTRTIGVGQQLSVISFNTGYAALGRDEDFFMDGGERSRPADKAVTEGYLRGITGALVAQDADVYLLQEVDHNSYRSFNVDQAQHYRRELRMSMACALNYKCDFVPFPWPPIGKVESGLATYTSLPVTEATRESLPVPFAWPVRAANLKRCLLVQRVPVEGSDRELVIINLHLEAYDDGEGKIAQTKQLMELIDLEYRKGNYVIAGGDFNQTFEGAQDVYPLLDESYWQPGRLYDADLPAGCRYVYDASAPTCRLLNAPYTGDRANTQLYVIDGYIVTDNLHVNHIQTIDMNFAHSDHNPVLLQVTLL